MDQGLATVIGMSIAYFVSLLGMGLAYRSYRRHHAGDKS